MIKPCFVCSKELGPSMPENINSKAPMDAITFRSPGGYGSTVFDENVWNVRFEMEINICDECIKAAAARIYLIQHVYTPPNPPIYSEWTAYVPR